MNGENGGEHCKVPACIQSLLKLPKKSNKFKTNCFTMKASVKLVKINCKFIFYTCEFRVNPYPKNRSSNGGMESGLT